MSRSIGCRLVVALALATTLATGGQASAGFLIGTWVVRCPAGHDDVVRDITKTHDCEKCNRKSVDGGSADVVCPNGHASHVEDVTAQHACPTCKAQCRRN